MDPIVGVIMGSKSDWDVMSHCVKTLEQLNVAHEAKIISAHRTPDLLFEYASTAEDRGLEVIIAGAGMAAHLPGVTAAKTSLPVLGVPLTAAALDGLDALLSMVQMPAGVPVATFAIGKAGAVNAALFAANIVSARHPECGKALQAYRTAQRETLLAQTDPTTLDVPR